MEKDNFRTIQSVGRNQLIQELSEVVGYSDETIHQGIGDDAAVLAFDEDKFLLVSTEAYVEGVDFDLTYTPFHHLGFKVVSSAVSDIYAMNGMPKTIFINLAVPNKLSIDMLKEIYRGIDRAGQEYKVQLAGGDLTASHQTLSINVACTGEVEKDAIIYRSGARSGDAICVTGDLGGAIAGLRILMREKKYWQEQENQQQAFQPDLSDYEYVVRRQLVPAAQYHLRDIFREYDVLPTSMIDVTQGLVSEITQIIEASKTGAFIYQAALPIALETRQVADEMHEDVDKYALYGGEDLELVFTLPSEQAEKLAKNYKGFTIIGKITDLGEGFKMQTAEGDIAVFRE